jgi:ribose transport system substrate-binding protein
MSQQARFRRRRLVAAAVAFLASAIVLSGCSALGRSSSSNAASSSDCVPKGGKAPRSGGSKYVVYMSSLNIGNAWQEEAENLGLAEAKMAAYSKCIDVRKQLTTADPQSEISQIQSEVAAGADAIVNYALSPTAINAAYKNACQQGVTVLVYDATVTEPCVYNVSYLTSVPDGSTHPFMGYNSMEALGKLMHGKGNIFDVHGVVGTSTDNIHQEGLQAALKDYPGIHIATTYVGNWNSATVLAGTNKALASFPNVQGMWCGYGESGCVKALMAVGKQVPVSGETSQYFREQLLKGWPGVSIGSPPAQGGIGMKVALAVLLEGANGIPKDIEVPYKTVTAQNVKVCPGDTYTEGCNVFPPGKVGDEDTADIFNVMLPESSLSASQTGNPAAGATATAYTASYLQKFQQPESRRYVTRNTCPDGWKPGRLPEGVQGCVQ